MYWYKKDRPKENRSSKCKTHGKKISSYVLPALLALVLIASISSAGCVHLLNPLPHEVMVRENIIMVDSEYVPSSTIVSLLLNPNNYEEGLFNDLYAFMPIDKPVIEIGAGIGVVSAYINDKLTDRSAHVAYEPNPYYVELLKETKIRNNLGTRFVHAAIEYDSTFVPYRISKNVVDNSEVRTLSEELVNVPSITLKQAVIDAPFSDKQNITLVVDADSVLLNILENEPNIKESISTIITTVYNMDELPKIRLKAADNGYAVLNGPNTDASGLVTMIFKRK